MAEDDLAEIVAIDRLRILMLRDVIARLLAYVARGEPDPEMVLKNFFEAGDRKIDRFPATTEFHLRANEIIQADKDVIVETARRLMEL